MDRGVRYSLSNSTEFYIADEVYVRPSDLDENTLIPILLDPVRRQRLVDALEQEQGNARPLLSRYEQLAPVCHATPDELRAVIAVLRTRSYRAAHLLDELLFHPQLPDDLLLDLAQHWQWVTPLAHRAGPRVLLEYIAQTYNVSEAITTLALHHYTHESPAAFAQFIAQHRGDAMLRYNLAHSAKLSAEQRDIAQAVIAHIAK